MTTMAATWIFAAGNAREKAMAETPVAQEVTRRTILAAAIAGGAGLAGGAVAAPPEADADAVEEARRMTGKGVTPSPRLHLLMPSAFPHGLILPFTPPFHSKITPPRHFP